MNNGAYCWLNKVNDKRYVGGAYGSFEGRRVGHLCDLRAKKHGNKHLQAAWNKYGEGNFEFVILERCEKDEETIRLCEQKWIDHYRAYDRRYGYNVCRMARSTLGLRHSRKTRKRMSEKRKGLVRSPEAIAKGVATRKANQKGHGPKTRRKIARAARRQMLARSEQERRQMATLAAKKRWSDPLARQKASERMTGKKLSDQFRRTMSRVMKGNTNGRGHRGRPWPQSSETKAKISATLTGRKKSARARANMVAAWVERRKKMKCSVL